MSRFSHQSITALLIYYRFDLGSSQVETVVVTWIEKYDSQWIVWAIVEALYQRCYKTISVTRILERWDRLGNPKCHFSIDYELRILSALSVQEVGRSTSNPTDRQRSKLTPNLPLDQPRDNYFRSQQRLDPDLTPPGMVCDHPLVLCCCDRVIAAQSDRTPELAPPIAPAKSPEKILLDADPSPFFDKLKNMAGND
jgi:hypothetical protein